MKMPRRSDHLAEKPPETDWLREEKRKRRARLLRKIAGWAVALLIIGGIIGAMGLYLWDLQTNSANLNQQFQARLTGEGYALVHVDSMVSCSGTLDVPVKLFVQNLVSGNHVIYLYGGGDRGPDTVYYQVNGNSCVTAEINGYTHGI